MATVKPADAKLGDTVEVGVVDYDLDPNKDDIDIAEASVTKIRYNRAKLLESKQRMLQELESIEEHKATTQMRLNNINAILAKIDELRAK